MLVTRAYEMKSWNHIKLKRYKLLRRQTTILYCLDKG